MMKKILFLSLFIHTVSGEEIYEAHLIQTIESQRITNECNLLQLQALERGMNEIIQDGKSPADAAKKISALIDKENAEFQQCFAKKAWKKSEHEIGYWLLGGAVGCLAGFWIGLAIKASK